MPYASYFNFPIQQQRTYFDHRRHYNGHPENQRDIPAKTKGKQLAQMHAVQFRETLRLKTKQG
jgi:hypothetical protein